MRFISKFTAPFFYTPEISLVFLNFIELTKFEYFFNVVLSILLNRDIDDELIKVAIMMLSNAA
jgi:hypothetical protein